MGLHRRQRMKQHPQKPKRRHDSAVDQIVRKVLIPGQQFANDLCHHKERNDLKHRADDGENHAQNIGGFFLSGAGNEVGDNAHNEVAQRHGPVHPGHKPDDPEDHTENRDRPALVNLGHHEQLHRSAKQCAANRHIEGQRRIRRKENAAHKGEYEEQRREDSNGHKVLYGQSFFTDDCLFIS